MWRNRKTLTTQSTKRCRSSSAMLLTDRSLRSAGRGSSSSSTTSASPLTSSVASWSNVSTKYALSASYFLSGWTVLIYMTFPVVRLLTGAQPLAATTADQFLGHFAPYFGLSLLAVTALGGGAYTFKAFALQAA